MIIKGTLTSLSYGSSWRSVSSNIPRIIASIESECCWTLPVPSAKKCNLSHVPACVDTTGSPWQRPCWLWPFSHFRIWSDDTPRSCSGGLPFHHSDTLFCSYPAALRSSGYPQRQQGADPLSVDYLCAPSAERDAKPGRKCMKRARCLVDPGGKIGRRRLVSTMVCLEGAGVADSFVVMGILHVPPDLFALIVEFLDHRSAIRSVPCSRSWWKSS